MGIMNGDFMAGWWFQPTPPKNHGVSEFVSWDFLKFPTEWKVIKSHGSKAPTSHIIYTCWLNPNGCNNKHETEHEKEHGGSERKARTRARKVSRRERKKSTN